jgi:CBS domain-containing protein
MNVSEIMETEVVAAHPDDDVQSVVTLMREHELPGVPVVDADGRVVGIVTEADLILRDEEADLHLPLHIDLMGAVIYLGRLSKYEERLKRALASTVADLMTADPVTVSPDTSVQEAGRVIAERKHNRLPVVDGDGRLVGVVTRLDVLDALTRG